MFAHVSRCAGVLHQGCKPPQCQRDIPQLQHLICSGPVWHYTQACLRKVNRPCPPPFSLVPFVSSQVSASHVQYSAVQCIPLRCRAVKRSAVHRSTIGLARACNSSHPSGQISTGLMARCNAVHRVSCRHSWHNSRYLGLSYFGSSSTLCVLLCCRLCVQVPRPAAVQYRVPRVG